MAAVRHAPHTPMPERLTARAQRWIAAALHPGALALDATAGSGADTRFLAAAIGPGGRVHAWDRQRAALARAQARLAGAGLGPRVPWHLGCHSELGRRHGEAAQFAAAMFNLGWLPGGDRTLITRPETTLAALTQAAARLAPGGRLSILAYRGHAGGTEEAAAVAHWVATAAHGLCLDVAPCRAGTRGDGPVLYALHRPACAICSSGAE